MLNIPESSQRDVTQDTKDTQDKKRYITSRKNPTFFQTENKQAYFYDDWLAVTMDDPEAEDIAADAEEQLSNFLAGGESMQLQMHIVGAWWREVSHGENLDRTQDWQSPLWEFVRLVKAHPYMRDQENIEALAMIEDVISQWRIDEVENTKDIKRRAARRWTHWFYMEPEDARTEVLSIWEKVRCLPGSDPLQYAIERAIEKPIRFESDQLSLPTDGYERFLSVAGWLQVIVGKQNILLPCELLSKELNVSKMTISRYRDAAINDGLLQEVRKHIFAKGRRAATEFRFSVDRVQMLCEIAHRDIKNRGTTMQD